ncbi:MAG: PaaI family thioesterase [Kiloniellales bacterium]
MSILATIAAARRDGNVQAIADAIPHASFLGLETEIVAADGAPRLVTRLPHDPRHIGNPLLPALHGGVVAAFLQLTGAIELLWRLESESLPRSINITVDYLRPARAETLYASGIITKLGRRVANVRVEAWQEDASRPVAHGHAHYLVVPPA